MQIENRVLAKLDAELDLYISSFVMRVQRFSGCLLCCYMVAKVFRVVAKALLCGC